MARHVDVSVLVPVLNEASIIEDSVTAMLNQRFDCRGQECVFSASGVG